ncbi:hypothetical protein D3C87_1623590 [compost metagenome]
MRCEASETPEPSSPGTSAGQPMGFMPLAINASFSSSRSFTVMDSYAGLSGVSRLSLPPGVILMALSAIRFSALR